MKYFQDFNLDVSSFNKPTSSGIVNDYPIFAKPIPKISTNKDPFNIGFPEINFGDPVRLGDAQTDDFILKNTTPFNPVLSTKTAQITVSGLIVDNYGNPLPNASVHIVSNDAFQVGTTTDFDGNFSIKTMPNDVLEVNYLGYTPQRFTASQMPSTITLQESVEQLDEIVVDLRKPKDTGSQTDNQSGSSTKKESFLDKITTKEVLTYGGIGLGVLAVGYLVFSKPKTTKKAGLKGAKKTIHVTL